MSAFSFHACLHIAHCLGPTVINFWNSCSKIKPWTQLFYKYHLHDHQFMIFRSWQPYLILEMQPFLMEKVCLWNRCGLWLDVPGQMVCIRANRSPEASFFTSSMKNQPVLIYSSRNSRHPTHKNGAIACLERTFSKMERKRELLSFKLIFAIYISAYNIAVYKALYVGLCDLLYKISSQWIEISYKYNICLCLCNFPRNTCD